MIRYDIICPMTHPHSVIGAMTVNTWRLVVQIARKERRKLKINLRTLRLRLSAEKKKENSEKLCFSSYDKTYMLWEWLRYTETLLTELSESFIMKKAEKNTELKWRFNSCSCSCSPAHMISSQRFLTKNIYQTPTCPKLSLMTTINGDERHTMLFYHENLHAHESERTVKYPHRARASWEIFVKYQWTISWLRTDTGIRRVRRDQRNIFSKVSSEYKNQKRRWANFLEGQQQRVQITCDK